MGNYVIGLQCRVVESQKKQLEFCGSQKSKSENCAFTKLNSFLKDIFVIAQFSDLDFCDPQKTNLKFCGIAKT